MQRKSEDQGLRPEVGIDDKLKLSNFEGKFDVTDFVGSVSERLIAQSKADSEPFDPKPFIRTFEEAIDKLLKIRKDVQAKTEQMEKSVRVAEREYSKKMAELNKGFESVGSAFSGMESRMSEVGRIAIRVGEQLETVHLERQRAQAAYDLIDYYNQFSRDDTSRLDVLKKEGREGRRQVAVLLRRLNTVAKEVDLPKADETRERIEKYCEKFEKDMLYLFDRCYRKGDPKMMHHCAQTLLEFNGGASCIQVYVNQHDFFINRVQEDDGMDGSMLWTTLPDPDASPPKSEIGLSNLFAEIRSTVEQEAQIVKAVFPNPPIVMQVFLQRVFAQSIQQYLERLLTKGGTVSEFAYLRVLQLVHIQTSLLVEDLKAYELPIPTSPRSPIEVVEYRRALAGMPTATSGGPTAVSHMLETALEELFVPYTEGQRYLECESRSLGALYSNLLGNFTKYHERTHKGKASMFDRIVNQLSAAAATTATAEGGSSTTAQAAAALMRFGGITDRTVDKEEPVKEEWGQLSVDTAEKMLKWHAEATGRCVELSPPNDVAKNTFALLRVLAVVISNGYMETAVESALARIEGADAKTEPSLQPLTVLSNVDRICHLWQQYVNTALLPLAVSFVTIRREMVVFNNQTVSRLEGAANTLMQRFTDSIIAWLSLQLSKQKKNDFKPRNDDISFARVNTEPCDGCCEILERVGVMARRSLSGKNLEIFLTEIGIAFHSMILEHLRKFPVSDSGGLMLAKDLKSYQDTIDAFGIPSLHERFEFIRQLGNVFLVRPEALKSYITENYLGRIEPALLRPYLAQRGDWAHFEKGFTTDGFDAEEISDEVPGLPGYKKGFKAGKYAMGRLSVMMKDLEVSKLGENLSMPASLAGGFSITGRLV